MGCCFSDFFGCPQDLFCPQDVCCFSDLFDCPLFLYRLTSKKDDLNWFKKINVTTMIQRHIKNKKELKRYDPRLRDYLIENISQCQRSNVSVIEGPVFRWKKRVIYNASIDKLVRFYENSKQNSKQSADTCLLVTMFPDRQLNRVPIQLTNCNRMERRLKNYFPGDFCLNNLTTEKTINIIFGTPFYVDQMLRQKLKTKTFKYKHIFVSMYEADVMLYNSSYNKTIHNVLTMLSKHCQLKIVATTNYLTCKVKRFAVRFSGDEKSFAHIEMKKKFKRMHGNDLDFSVEIRKDFQDYVKDRFEDDRKYIRKYLLKSIYGSCLTVLMKGPIGNHKKYVAYRAILDKVLKFYRSLKTCSKNQDSFQVVLMFPDKDMAQQHQVEATSLTSLKVVADDLLPRDCRGQPKWSWNDITSDKSINIVAGEPQEIEKMVKQKKTFSKFLSVLIIDVDVMVTDRHYWKALKNVNRLLSPMIIHRQVILTSRELSPNVRKLAFRYSGHTLGFVWLKMRKYN